MVASTCSFPGCTNSGRISQKLKLCEGHSKQVRLGESLRPIRFMGTPSGGTCSFEGCGQTVNDKARLSGLCKEHYHQRRRRRALGLEPLMLPLGYSTRPRTLLPNPDMPGTLLVPLTKGYFAIIDEADGPAVAMKRWSAATHPGRRGVYARTTDSSGDGRLRPNGKMAYPAIPLHRFLWRLWGLPDTPEIDHKNTNGIDCRRENLRAATRQQNSHNVAPRKDNTSGFKGVHWDSRTGRWGASITVGHRSYWLGRFDDPAEAGRAYEKAAKELHGDFARVA